MPVSPLIRSSILVTSMYIHTLPVLELSFAILTLFHIIIASNSGSEPRYNTFKYLFIGDLNSPPIRLNYR